VSNQCRVCTSPCKAEIEKVWLEKTITRPEMQKKYGIHETSLRFHMKNHIEKMGVPYQPKQGLKTCQTCASPLREAIETAWVMKTLPHNVNNPIWLEKFGVSGTAVEGHCKKHLTREARQIIYARATQAAAEQVVEADTINIRATIIKLTEEAKAFLEQAKTDKDIRAGVATLAELRRNVELFAKVTGELNTGVSTGISPKSEGWITVRNVLMDVLSKYPDAKAEFLSRIGHLALEAR